MSFVRYWLGIASVAVLAPALVGQTLHLSSASGSRGDQITIELSLESAPGKEPVALQWETHVPIGSIMPLDEKRFSSPVSGKKSLNCALKEKNADSYVWRCILAGGEEAIGNGAIGRLRLRIAVNAPLGAVHIRVEKATGVSGDAKAVPLDPTDTVVTVRK